MQKLSKYKLGLMANDVVKELFDRLKAQGKKKKDLAFELETWPGNMHKFTGTMELKTFLFICHRTGISPVELMAWHEKQMQPAIMESGISQEEKESLEKQ